METGNYNILKVVRATDHGLYLCDENGEEVLLPKKFVTDKMKPGTLGQVFVYPDSEDRLVATTQKPLATTGQVAYLAVKEISSIGTFLDWGLDKDLLLPFSEQQSRPQPGEHILVFVYIDRATGRIVATQNLNKFIKNREVKFFENTEVDLLIGEKTEQGYRVIINQKYWGMLYHNEIFKSIETGMMMKGYIKKVRDDHKIDVALQKQGLIAAIDVSHVILEKLKTNNGYLPLSDHSSPQQITNILGISKKNFKKSVGALYKKKQIAIRDDGIYLL